jgi:hypothetical protein
MDRYLDFALDHGDHWPKRIGWLLLITMLALPASAVVYPLIHPKQPTKSFDQIRRDLEQQRAIRREIDLTCTGICEDEQKFQQLAQELECAEERGDKAEADRLVQQVQNLHDKWTYR